MEHLPNYFIGPSVFVLGLIIGSFLNVVIHRLPLGESVVFPASHCPGCNERIKPNDNIPVVSYLLLKGRCRNCGVRISPVYPAVELLAAVLYLVFFLRDGLTLRFAADAVFVSLVIPLIFIDLFHKLIFNVVTLPGFAAMVILRALAPDPLILRSTRAVFGSVAWPDWAVAVAGAALGAAVGAGLLWFIRTMYFVFRHREGMGLGDVKMMLMVGAFLGWQLTLITIFLASLGGSITGLMIIWLRGGDRRTEIPFGVFLGPAAIVTLFVGESFINWYAGAYR